MFIQKIQKFKYYFISFLALMPLLALADAGLERAVGGTGLIQGTTTQILIGNIINGLLSVLGMIFMGLIIWGGFKWMTAQGNTEQVSGAKDVIRNATIGLVVVLASYGIINFVLEVVVGATNNPPEIDTRVVAYSSLFPPSPPPM